MIYYNIEYLVCVMCGTQSVSCAVFTLCYVALESSSSALRAFRRAKLSVERTPKRSAGPFLRWRVTKAAGAASDVCCPLLAAGGWMLDAGCSLLASGCWLMSDGCWLLGCA